MSKTVPAPAALTQLVEVFTSPDVLVLVSRLDDAQIVALSPGFEPLLGISAEQAIGRTAMEMGLWRDQRSREGVVSMLVQRGCAVGEPIAIRHSESEYLDGLLTANLIDYQGQRYVIAVLNDIRRYPDEASAREREAHGYRALVMESDFGIYRRNARSGELLEVNPALARLLGYPSPQELLQALADSEHFPYADIAHARELRAELLDQGVITLQSAQIRRPDSSVLWISESARVVHDGGGEPLYIEGTLIDISDKIEAQQALSQSEALYRNLVENSRDGVFLMQHGRIVFANDALGEILNYTSEEMIGASYFDWVCPEDLKAQAERRSQREAGSYETQEYEIHLLRRDGERRLCAVRAGAVEYRGAPASIGTMRDITEVRAQQKRLEAAEERYRLLFQHAVLGMFQSTRDGQMVEVNEAMAQMFGFDTPAAMVREVGNMSQWYVDREERERLLKRIVEEGQIVGQEVELYRRNGERFWALTSTRLVRRDDDDPGFLEGSLLDNSARRAAEQELRFLAHHDNLTGLPSRRSFEIELDQALQQSQVDGLARGVLLLDLDRFKLVNDSLGHAAGDDLLVKFSARITKALAAKVVIARYGGDEFALLTRSAVDGAGAEAIAKAVNQILASPFQVRGHQVFTGASIGIVLIRGGERKAEDLMRDADTAMFRAKALGGGGHAMFDSHMHSAARERLSLETELRFALERNELEAWFQPMHSLQTRQIVGVESLARWRHPRRGLLLPAQFLGVAEESGMLPGIDLRMLELALRHFSQWQEQHPENAPKQLSVNISDRLFTSSDFAEQLSRRLRQSHVAPASVQLEITETVFRGALGNLHKILSALKQIGVKLVVDDFGTGYSSLVSFSESNFDGLKVDRGFIHDIDCNERHRAIVRTIVQFAADLGLSVVAEGVETEIQAQMLADLGCEVVQGFLFTKALSAEALGARLASGSQRGPQQVQLGA